MSNGFLRVEGEKVVDGKGNRVILRGAGLGGWMNMENFMYISSFPNNQCILIFCKYWIPGPRVSTPGSNAQSSRIREIRIFFRQIPRILLHGR